MTSSQVDIDIVVVGAGPVGLMCAHLARLCGLTAVVADKSSGPLQVGRADALNARTLQLLEVAGLFDELYPLGKPCNTSSVWSDGRFVSRQSTWWDAIEGCFHKHFLMLGQAHVEQLLDAKLHSAGAGARRETSVVGIELAEDACVTTLSNGEALRSRFVIGADGSRSFVRDLFAVPFEVTRPQLVWAVLDGVIETDFPKVPEIIAFQADTADVAWIPREGDIDRFYVRMDTKEFTVEEAVAKINRAMSPHTLRFTKLAWFSQFSVKESVAERFSVQDRVFLAGDACHIHSVNGGQGLNTGLADAFNLIWKLHQVLKFGAPVDLLRTYEAERKPVALSVIQASGELVRSTKYADQGNHASDYVKIVEKRAGNITGMGIRYGEEGIVGTRLFDFLVQEGHLQTRIYSLLDYSRFTLLVIGEAAREMDVPDGVRLIRVPSGTCPYADQLILVRPDSFIAGSGAADSWEPRIAWLSAATARPSSVD
jgi:2-polyprenyl-6-methoxyphenol hydroxylase-like FAD-dependent oxidoreductase